jgi:hypothetical protein
MPTDPADLATWAVVEALVEVCMSDFLLSRIAPEKIYDVPLHQAPFPIEETEGGEGPVVVH